jgi:hypothetical protein
MRVHLIGLGVTGSLLARLLEYSGIAFTWHDIEAEHVAWKAATGAVYPCGKPGREDYETWREWLGDYFIGENWWELARYWYNHKKAPHKSFLKEAFRTEGGLAVSPAPSIHINSQSLVALTREKYADLRREGNPEEVDYLILANGFNSRMEFAYWGWSCLVELVYGSAIPEYLSVQLSNTLRSCFYLREGKFIMTYAYPVPGNLEAHYAGSSFLRQTPGKMHSLKMPAKFEKWKSNFERLSKGEVTVRRALADPVEGWRPAMSSGEEDVSIKREGNVLQVPPLGGSGIRRLPSVWRNLKAHF